MNQCERILELLKGRDWVSNIKIHETTGIYRYPSRVWDINQNPDKYGYRIESKYGKKSIYYYRAVKISNWTVSRKGEGDENKYIQEPSGQMAFTIVR